MPTSPLPPTSWPPDSGASPGGAKRPVAMPTTQAGRAPWRWVTGAPPRVLGPGGQGMCGRQVSKVPGLAHTPPVLAWGRGLHPTQPFCSLCPYLHRCGSQGDSGTGTLQTLGLLWRVDRGNMVSACWLTVLDIGKTLPTKSTPTQTPPHQHEKSWALSTHHREPGHPGHRPPTASVEFA